MKPDYRRRYTPPARPGNPLSPAAVERLRKMHATCPRCQHEHPDDGGLCNAPIGSEVVGVVARVVLCRCRGILP